MNKITKISMSVFIFSAAMFSTTHAPVKEAEAANVYKNCATFNKSYPAGVRKSASIKNKVVSRSGKVTYRATKAKVSASIYSKAMKTNSKLDRDGDGIACEK